jgi:hypothetical protein
LSEAVSRASDPRRRARLLVSLGIATRDDDAFVRGVELAKEHGGDELHAELLRRWARALDLSDRVDDALARAEQSAALEEANGSYAGAAAARMLAAAIARSTDDGERAIAFARRAEDDRLRIGDVRGALRAAQFVVALLIESSRGDEARPLAEHALSLASAIGDGSAIGYLRWVLGALADRDADPRGAAEQYRRAIAAYRDDDAPVPERLLDAVRAAELANQPETEPLAETRVRLSLIPAR